MGKILIMIALQIIASGVDKNINSCVDNQLNIAIFIE
jgi:hypothetical protein